MFKKLRWWLRYANWFTIYRQVPSEMLEDSLKVYKLGMGTTFSEDTLCNSDIEYSLHLFWGLLHIDLCVDFVMSPEEMHAAGITGIEEATLNLELTEDPNETH